MSSLDAVACVAGSSEYCCVMAAVAAAAAARRRPDEAGSLLVSTSALSLASAVLPAPNTTVSPCIVDAAVALDPLVDIGWIGVDVMDGSCCCCCCDQMVRNNAAIIAAIATVNIPSVLSKCPEPVVDTADVIPPVRA
ncbi:hypothetical protein SYNPS1DRAFT_29042 [Syncephalis pseudoplumigaleata]|uniref:Uncharacterized protein n=1 Tax=Syncephalis pseudoplumigaleata TaxID=1712513 RepID=A0A4P9Z1E8_9FUNG|nr:hypothetical protein SYNPS1DRAFT_29042 [Syncephalis pseudoplumigaleata]|eukprot:RKP25220.1 hypothetical protein SYNPS1DRAFT_29042 [Syncephalis pseudoplumigaleata]